jgi:hypothetical protein
MIQLSIGKRVLREDVPRRVAEIELYETEHSRHRIDFVVGEERCVSSIFLTNRELSELHSSVTKYIDSLRVS